jgi:O-antigen/teichoic acid export membrane protein
MALLIAAYGVFFLVVLWFFGEAILRLLYGEPYAAGYAIIRIMSVIPLFKGSSFICVAIMVSHGQQHRRVALQFGAASLSVLGGLLIIPAFGIQGAAALQVVVEFVLLLLYALGAGRWQSPGHENPAHQFAFAP